LNFVSRLICATASNKVKQICADGVGGAITILFPITRGPSAPTQAHDLVWPDAPGMRAAAFSPQRGPDRNAMICEDMFRATRITPFREEIS
jgi:hypothetical protein